LGVHRGDLPDLAALMNVRRIEGFLNIFRSPGFLSLHGLENLEVVEGNLYIHLNPNLTSIAALGKLRIVTGNLYIVGNDQLPQAEVDALGARVTVGGTKTLSYPPP
jgi:Receptor L domain